MASHAKQLTEAANTPHSEKMRGDMHRQMLSAVSHDLKTPLATIIGSLEVFNRMDGKLTPEKKAALVNSALAEAYRLDNFITNILDMAKLESGQVQPRAEACNLHQLISDCVTRLGPKRARCEITFSGDKSQVVKVDPMLLGRSVSLVLENAVKHAGKRPVIQVGYGCEGAGCFIRIRDHGAGIPEGKERAIFSKYTRFARADHQNAGTGLGLAICRQLMALISGTVQAENHAGGGAMFTLAFPA